MKVRFALLVLICSALWGWSPLAAATPWLPFGPDGGDARRLATDPADPAHLFLGTATGWIFETRNSGLNWHRLALVGKRNDLVVDSIFVDPSNARHLVVGAWTVDHPDGGIFLSTDGGTTWINQAEMRGQSIRSLAYSLSDPKILVAGSLQGVFRSVDGGQRWKRISPRDSTEIHEVESVAIDPIDPNIIYAGTWHLPWKTVDGGDHWDNIKDGIIDDSDVFSIIVDPQEPKVVFASACSGIYKSSNSGLHFDKVQGIPSTSRRTRVLLQDPGNRAIVFAGTTEGLFRSEDSGKTWVAKTGPEIIVYDVAIDAKNSRRVLIATEHAGVMASDDGGETFHPQNGGFSSRQITTLRRDSTHPATVFVGVVNDKEWGGVFRSDNGGLNWAQRSAGLQGRDVFALGQAPDGTMIAGTSHGLFRYDSEANDWTRVEQAPGLTGADTPVEPVRPATIMIRASVPIGRNHFAERTSTRPVTPSQKKIAALSSSRKRVRKPVTKGTPATRKAQLLAAKKRAAVKTKAPIRTVSSRTATRPATALQVHTTQAALPAAPPIHHPGFDGSVYVLATSGHVLLAATSEGLLTSSDNGESWIASGPEDSADWRYLATAKQNVVAASLQAVQFSSNSGATWVAVKLPELMTRVAAVAVAPSGEIWVGGREGVFVSSDAGETWTTPKNLYVNSVSSLYYDEVTDRITLTTAGAGTYSGIVFTVQLPEKSVTYMDTGWTLRFARPVGDHLVGATLFDGIVVQPKMVASPPAAAESALR